MATGDWVYSNGAIFNTADLCRQMGLGVGTRVEPDQDKFLREYQLQNIYNSLGIKNKSEQSINKNLLLLEDV